MSPPATDSEARPADGRPAPATAAGRLRGRPTSTTLRRLALASLLAQAALVLTGGAVRLTGSGLGCPTFPSCTDESLVNTPEYGIHGYIEFGNRLLTFVLTGIAVATLVAVWRARPVRRDLRRLALLLLLGIPAQALIGGITVLTGLNPWTVMAHLLVSATLIGVATVLWRRVDEPPQHGGDTVVEPWTGRLAGAVVAVTYAVVAAGTVVTGSGPHAGDETAARTGLDLEQVTQLHADLVFLLVGLSVGLWYAVRATGARGRTARATTLLLAAQAAQAAVGFAQYALGVPVLLVALHLLGASLLVVAAVDAWLAVRAAASPAGEQGQPDEATPSRAATAAA